MVLVTKELFFKSIFGWSVGVRDTSYATKMQWSMWEDRVEEVLTPIMLEDLQKNKELLMTSVKNWIGEFIGYLFLIVFAFGWMDTLWIFGVENSKEYTWWYLIQQLGMYFGG